MIKVGIIGTGGMANAHAQNYQKMRGVQVVACLDVVEGRAQAFAEKYKIPHACSSLKELFSLVDAVSIVTPDRFHAEPTIAALKAKKHVLCEKPLTTTLAEARKVAAAAKKAKGIVGMVNFSYRRSAAFQKAISLMKSGAIGEVRHVHAHYLQGWLPGIREPKSGDKVIWRLQKAWGGGVLADLGCHILDLSTAVVGPVASARCDLANFPKVNSKGKAFAARKGEKMDADDTAAIHLQFANGHSFGVVHTTRWATGRGNTIKVEVHGTTGALMFDLDRSYEQLDVYDRAKNVWKTLTLKQAPDIYQRFIKSIKTGVADQPDLERGAEIQSILDACARSGKSGRFEKIAKAR
jgi:predicted dehydrogenase